MAKSYFVTGPHNALFAAAIVLLIIATINLYNQSQLEIDAEIVAIEKKCQQPLNNRCMSIFTMKNKYGSTNQTNRLGIGYPSTDIKIGNWIKKDKFNLHYQVNGVIKDDGDDIDFLLTMLASLVALVLWRILTPRRVMPTSRNRWI